MKKTIFSATAFAPILFSTFQLWSPLVTAPAVQPQQTAQQPAQPSDGDLCGIGNDAFQGGEQLTYKVYFNWNFVWMEAGEVTFKVEDQGNLLHLVVEGKTYRSYEWFFKVRDRYESYVDKATLQPTMSIRDIQEGNFAMFSKQTFDHKNKTVAIEEGKSRAENNKSKQKFTGCVHDIVSMIYYARNLDQNDYKKDDLVPVKVFMDKQTYALNVHYKGKQNGNTIRGMGTYNTYTFTPEMVKGEVFKEQKGMKVVCSDDKNRIPLLIESPLALGYIKVMLTDSKGLRNPFTAKVK